MWKGSRVVVVVPAWNEAPRIARVLRGLPDCVDAAIVVDDASTDATGEVARAVGDTRVEVVRHERNRGVGAAIVTGYTRAAAVAPGSRDAFVVMAGDGQMDPRDLHALVEPIAADRADYVKGDRFRDPGVWRSMPFARALGGLALSRLTSIAIGVPISDSQCGYTAIARDACARLELAELWPGYGYPNDLLSRLALERLRIAEVAVRAVYADEVSRLRARHVPVIAGIVARAWARRVHARWIEGGPRFSRGSKFAHVARGRGRGRAGPVEPGDGGEVRA
jgi:glycosyltransferase involved in cell wall biosynthesis